MIQIKLFLWAAKLERIIEDLQYRLAAVLWARYCNANRGARLAHERSRDYFMEYKASVTQQQEDLLFAAALAKEDAQRQADDLLTAAAAEYNYRTQLARARIVALKKESI